MTDDDRTMIQGSIEYLEVTLADHDAREIDEYTLDTGAVSISLTEGDTWLPAAWFGDVFLTHVVGVGTRAARTARTLLDTTAMPKAAYPVWSKFVDTPESPIDDTGTLRVI
jgi:hypothetical protein